MKDFPARGKDAAPRSPLTEASQVDINTYGEVGSEKNGNTSMLYCADTTLNEPSLLQTKVMKPDQVWWQFARDWRLSPSVPIGQWRGSTGTGGPSRASVLPVQALANSTPMMNDSLA
jgi:hypothetical protein